MKRHVKEFVKSMDDFLKIDGKLVEHFKPDEQFAKFKEDEVLPFE